MDTVGVGRDADPCHFLLHYYKRSWTDFRVGNVHLDILFPVPPPLVRRVIELPGLLRRPGRNLAQGPDPVPAVRSPVVNLELIPNPSTWSVFRRPPFPKTKLLRLVRPHRQVQVLLITLLPIYLLVSLDLFLRAWKLIQTMETSVGL
jgi:hypothetical protein